MGVNLVSLRVRDGWETMKLTFSKYGHVEDAFFHAFLEEDCLLYQNPHGTWGRNTTTQCLSERNCVNELPEKSSFYPGFKNQRQAKVY